MICGRRRRARRFVLRRRHIAIILAVLLLVVLIRGFEKQISNFSADYLPSFAKQASEEVINSAVLEELDSLGYTYSDLVVPESDDSKTVKEIKTDSVKIDILKSRVTNRAQEELRKIKHSKMTIPLGAFTGLSLIANYGPEIPLTYCITGSVNARLVSELESAGVNRSIHHIKLIVSVSAVTASVDYSGDISYETDFEIAQSVISGDVSCVYGGSWGAAKP